jgi:hypothetical protein
MIKEIAERYPELRGAKWDETRAIVLKAQAESDAQVQISMRELEKQSPK